MMGGSYAVHVTSHARTREERKMELRTLPNSYDTNKHTTLLPSTNHHLSRRVLRRMDQRTVGCNGQGRSDTMQQRVKPLRRHSATMWNWMLRHTSASHTTRRRDEGGCVRLCV